MHAEKENECLRILYDIIDSFKSGLTIGNLTSQFFANYYLSPLDHYVLEQLKPAGYVRYMDDIIVFSDSVAELNCEVEKMKRFIKSFGLEFKAPVINRCKNGVPFLGHLVSDKTIKLLEKNRKLRAKRVKLKLTPPTKYVILQIKEMPDSVGRLHFKLRSRQRVWINYWRLIFLLFSIV